MDFEQYWTLIGGETNFANRKDAARDAWNAHPQKQSAIITWLQTHGRYPGRNPYFFILDFQVKKPLGTPTNYNGRNLPKEPVFSAKYNGQWGMYTQADIDKYGLEKAQSAS